MSQSAPKTNEGSVGLNRSHLLAIMLVALGVAAAPHFFLDMPLEFYGAGNMRGWLGLSIWSPAFLGAVALFFGVDMGARVPQPWIANFDLRAAAGIAVPVLVLVMLSYRYLGGFHIVGDWEELGLAMLLYAGTFAIGALFWQGMLQHETLAPLGRYLAGRLLRIAVIGLVACALWLPFLSKHSFGTVRDTLDGFLIIYLALALLFEVGLSVFACVGVAALMGVAWAWVHQMTFF